MLACNPALGKQADPQADFQAALKSHALKEILGLGLVGAGVGGGYKALTSIPDLFQHNLEKRRDVAHPSVIEVGVPEVQSEDEEVDQPRLSRGLSAPPVKLANEGAAATPWYKKIFPWADSNFWSGNRATSTSDIPWYWPAATAATVGGLYGGYKLVDKGMDWMKNRDRDKDLEDAKNEYRKALIEQHSSDSPAIKQSEVTNDLGRDLDTLHGFFEKQSLAGAATGAYLTLAGLLAGVSGMTTYNWAKSNSPDERLAKAIKQRERLRWAVKPPEIYAVSKPHPVHLANPEEEDVKMSSAKFAALYKP